MCEQCTLGNRATYDQRELTDVSHAEDKRLLSGAFWKFLNHNRTGPIKFVFISLFVQL